MTSAYLQVVRHWEVFIGGNGSVTQTLWEAQGVAQHHDGVSGTAKQAVTYDYAQRLSVGYDAASRAVSAAIGQGLTRQGGDVPAFTSCPLLNQSICSVTTSSGQVVIFLYNPLVRPRTERVTVPWSSKAPVTVTDGAGGTVPSVVLPTMPNLARNSSDSAPLEVHFIADLVALGINTYFITPTTTSDDDSALAPAPGALQSAAEALARIGRHPHRLRPLSTPAPAPPAAPLADPTISNEYWTLTFDGSTGLLSSVTDAMSGDVTRLSQNFFWYAGYQESGQDSGAYIFRPVQSNATATPVATAVSNLSVLSTAVVSEARQVFAPWLSQIVRLTAGSRAVEFEWTVGHIPVGDGQGKEIISRFTTDLPTAATWYTDRLGSAAL